MTLQHLLATKHDNSLKYDINNNVLQARLSNDSWRIFEITGNKYIIIKIVYLKKYFFFKINIWFYAKSH